MSTPFVDQNGHSIIAINVDGELVEVGSNPVLQEKSTIPTEEAQRITPSANYDGLSAVNVDRIPTSYRHVQGNYEITQNFTTVDVSNYQTVTINVRSGNEPPSGGSSSDQANAYHSIIFGDFSGSEFIGKNTWDDWHIVPTSRPKFNMPSVKTNFVDIPGSDGSIDLSSALTGRAIFNNRQGSFEFLVMNDYGYWVDRYSDIANYLHGRQCKAILCDDPEYYYEGRFYINEWKSEKNWSRIVIDYNVGPYKMSRLSKGEKWIWDDFNFLEDRIVTYRDIVVNSSVSGDYSLVYPADIYERSPIFTCSAYNNKPFEMTVMLNGAGPYNLNLGTNNMALLSYINGSDNTLVFHGTGIVSVENTGGKL